MMPPAVLKPPLPRCPRCGSARVRAFCSRCGAPLPESSGMAYLQAGENITFNSDLQLIHREPILLPLPPGSPRRRRWLGPLLLAVLAFAASFLSGCLFRRPWPFGPP